MKVVTSPIHNMSLLLEEGEASMELCVIVCRTALDCVINRSAGDKDA
jgi:hypothetical protein